jgi:hypothetical protein
MPVSKLMADIQITKVGPSGRPSATVLVDEGASLTQLSAALQKEITRNVDLRKKLGLKACLACTSGMDLDIRRRFDWVVQVDLSQFG